MSEEKKTIGPIPPLYINTSGGDKRVQGSAEAEVKADLSVRPLADLITQLEEEPDVEKRADLQKKITEIAKKAHDALGSNEA